MQITITYYIIFLNRTASITSPPPLLYSATTFLCQPTAKRKSLTYSFINIPEYSLVGVKVSLQPAGFAECHISAPTVVKRNIKYNMLYHAPMDKNNLIKDMQLTKLMCIIFVTILPFLYNFLLLGHHQLILKV